VELWKKGGRFDVIHQGVALWLTEKIFLGLGVTKISTFPQAVTSKKCKKGEGE